MPIAYFSSVRLISMAAAFVFGQTMKNGSTCGENWYFISESVKSHGRIVAISTGKKEPTLLFDSQSDTVFFLDCDYYGWIKSAALALAGDILEDNHNYFSIHGALLDVNGQGISIIGPSGTGKTTLSYGLLRHKGVKLVADDWHFFNVVDDTVTGYGSEKNSYIRADLAKAWPEYADIYEIADIDKKGRAIIDVARVLGRGSLKRITDMKKIFLLRREEGEEIIKRLNPEEAVKYMEKTHYCNPHLLQNDVWKKKLRRRAFLQLFGSAETYLINTIEKPVETLKRIAEIVNPNREHRKIMRK